MDLLVSTHLCEIPRCLVHIYTANNNLTEHYSKEEIQITLSLLYGLYYYVVRKYTVELFPAADYR